MLNDGENLKWIAIVENSLTVPQKVKHIMTPSYVPKRNGNTQLCKKVYMNVHGDIICNIPKGQTTLMPIAQGDG